MKAEELMIGDWVCVTKNFTQKYHKIRALSNDEGAVLRGIYVNEYGVKNHSIFSPNDTEPIPLTPEILEKNGFVSEDKAHYSFCGTDNILELLENETPFGIDGFDIVRTNKGINENKQSYYIDHYFASIYSVHQLQHALRLCGIDKEIIL